MSPGYRTQKWCCSVNRNKHLQKWGTLFPETKSDSFSWSVTQLCCVQSQRVRPSMKRFMVEIQSLQKDTKKAKGEWAAISWLLPSFHLLIASIFFLVNWDHLGSCSKAESTDKVALISRSFLDMLKQQILSASNLCDSIYLAFWFLSIFEQVRTSIKLYLRAIMDENKMMNKNFNK